MIHYFRLFFIYTNLFVIKTVELNNYSKIKAFISKNDCTHKIKVIQMIVTRKNIQSSHFWKSPWRLQGRAVLVITFVICGKVLFKNRVFRKITGRIFRVLCTIVRIVIYSNAAGEVMVTNRFNCFARNKRICSFTIVIHLCTYLYGDFFRYMHNKLLTGFKKILISLLLLTYHELINYVIISYLCFSCFTLIL